MYTDRNFKTKKQLREYFEAGKPVTVYQPGPFGMAAETGGVGQVRACSLEGPHYPQAHTWYAQGEYEVCSMQMVSPGDMGGSGRYSTPSGTSMTSPGFTMACLAGAGTKTPLTHLALEPLRVTICMEQTSYSPWAYHVWAWG